MKQQLETVINAAWEKRAELSIETRGEIRDAVRDTLDGLDKGQLRVAEKIGNEWWVHQWIKKAVLLSFRLNDNHLMDDGSLTRWFDKVPGKFQEWDEKNYRDAGFRSVPGSFVRHSAHI